MAKKPSVQVEDRTLASLIEEFARDYALQEIGRKHFDSYSRSRGEAREYYDGIVSRAERGEDVTNDVLLKLLPHTDNKPHRDGGAWVSVAPAIQGTVQGWFEASKWVKPDDWPHVAQEILKFVRTCVEHPEHLPSACDTFIKSGYARGFKLGMLTPILNALRPDVFAMFTSKSLSVLNRFTGKKFKSQLGDYPEANRGFQEFARTEIQLLLMPELAGRDVRDVFDMFSHWLVAVKPGSPQPVPEPGKENEGPSEQVASVAASKAGPYSMADLVRDSSFPEIVLKGWIAAIIRKRQAILYGPPGTGKTYIAERLARHLASDGGFVELVQFHPNYAYEDFMLGIRPQTRKDGQLEYRLENGRFLDFCQRAESKEGTCVLIIDEINRADLARVFGELMYLLEYRDQEIPLAAGRRFKIPANVRILGTMNTADRSIALVDHALRRRFAFLRLQPQMDVLRKYHQADGFPVEALIHQIELLNQRIGDPHYFVGNSFFMCADLEKCLADIWRMEIEPYLEEYFADRPEQVDELRWESVEPAILAGGGH